MRGIAFGDLALYLIVLVVAIALLVAVADEDDEAEAEPTTEPTAETLHEPEGDPA